MKLRKTAFLSGQRTILLGICVLLLWSACSSRRVVKSPPSTAAKAAETLAAVKNKELYRFIISWTGVPYRLGGLDKRGIDCSGFALLLHKEIYGKTLPRRSKDQANAIKSKNIHNLVEGDLIFFSFGGNEVDHVGVYLNNRFFVHASTNRGVIVDDLDLPVYQKAMVKAGSLK